MRNKTIDLENGITAILFRHADNKEVLIAGEDFFYVDTNDVPRIKLSGNKSYSMVTRDGKTSIVYKTIENKESRLSRLILDVDNNRSLVVDYANNKFYDLRKANLLQGTIGQKRHLFEEKRNEILKSLKSLPAQLNNVQLEQQNDIINKLNKQDQELNNLFKVKRRIIIDFFGLELHGDDLTIEQELNVTSSLQFVIDNFKVQYVN